MKEKRKKHCFTVTSAASFSP